MKTIDGSRISTIFLMLRSNGVLRKHAIAQVNNGIKTMEFNVKCQRCQQETSVLTGSYFDTSIICRACEVLEQHHPKHAEAKRIENEQVAQGNMNFAGIGLPSDWTEFVAKHGQGK